MMLRFRRLGFVSLLLAALLPAVALAAEKPITLSAGADFPGNDLRTIKNTDLQSCKAACTADTKCKAFTYNAKAQWCFLKTKADIVMAFPQAVAGETNANWGLKASGLNSELPFVDAAYIAQARALAATLKAAPKPENKSLESLRAEIQTKIETLDFQGAADLSKALITLGDDSYLAWRSLALALAAVQTADSNALYYLNQDGLSAAYNAYERAVTRGAQEAESIALVGNMLGRSGSTRAAINAYAMASAIHPAPALVKAHEEAKLRWGFRVLDYTVNADAADPRVCVQFSEELKRGRIDYLPFVTIDGQPAAGANAQGRELCVDGMKRGIRQALTIREGLPSEIGEVTLKPVTLSVFIRDRAPTVRFTGTSYVLPGAGRHGVPVISVNSAEIAVNIFHVPERGLAAFVKNSQFLQQVSGYDSSNLQNDSGNKVWSGVLTAEVKLNEEVTTSFPLDQALKDRKPGVYVMTAAPKEARIDEWTSRATQWLIVSDLGLTTMSNESGLSVFVRSLNTADPVAGVTVTLVSRSNAVLGTAKTNEMGLAQLEGGLMRGTGGNAPQIVTVDGADGDFGFIDLGRAAFDLSDRGVAGREAPGPIDVFMYSDRGIYRPGHTVHLSALARDDKAVAIAGLPLTLIVRRPDGIEYQRFPVQDTGSGGYQLDIDLKPSAMRGIWTVAAFADPEKGNELSSYRFRVDDFVPDRIEFDLKTEAAALALEGPTEATVEARFLYGAPASGLPIEGDLTLRATRTIPDYVGYEFGLEERYIDTGRTELSGLGETDENGQATLSLEPTSIPQTTQPLEAVINIRVAENGGRAVERSLTLPAGISSEMIGIKPLFADLAEGALAQFDVIAIDRTKSRIGSGPLSWELVRITNDYQWYFANNYWNYEPIEYTERIANGKIEAGADTAARIESKVDWGSYRLIIESDDPNGPVASYNFYSGWYVSLAAADTPDVLQIALDKKAYKAGDTAKVKIIPRFAGTALVNVVAEKLVDMKAAEIPATGGEVEFTVTEDWTPGTYVTATLYRPSTEESRLPGRAIGVIYAPKDESARTIGVTLDAPKDMKPRSTLTVPLTLTGVKEGDEAYVTVAAVDVGVLNVTRFTPPDADGWYYGQRRLATELRDIYGQLIDGSLGADGTIRTGGGDEADAASVDMGGNPETTEVVALFSGVVSVGPDGKAQVSFDVPEFNGTLRLMAVAWSKSAVGDASADVTVRDPVVITASLPRVMAPGDSARLRLDIDNTDGPAGSYTLSVSGDDGIVVQLPRNAMVLEKGKRTAVTLPLKADSTGFKKFTVKLTHESGLFVEKSAALLVRPGQPPMSSRRIVSLKPGQSLALSADMLANMINGTGSVTAAVTRSGALDIPGLLQSLDRYPYGCTEQTTSRALPLLYLDEVAARSGLEGDVAIRDRVQKAVYDVLANQSTDGSFGLWSSYSTADLWLDAFVTDFLTRAKEEGYDVPKAAHENALANIQNIVGYTQTVEERPSDIAYALYVLARNKKAAMGDIRFYAETKLESFPSPLAKAQLGAALALYGDKERSSAVMAAALKAWLGRKEEDWLRVDYGSNLRDGAALLALAAESDPASPIIAKLTPAVVTLHSRQRWTSTQEDSWLLLAARALLASAEPPKVEVAGKSFEGDYVRKFAAADLASGKISLVNKSDHAVDAVLTTTGVPVAPDPAGGDGFAIERQYWNFDGTPADLANLKQNDRVVVSLKVRQLNAWPSKIMVTDLVPSGLEIDNPGLVASANLSGFDWLTEAPGSAYLEFRDDRFAASLTRSQGDNGEVMFAYVARAVTPGGFVLPPAFVEDMYRPYLNARTATGVLEVK